MKHLILLTIPVSILVSCFLFYDTLNLANLIEIFLNQILSYFVTIPFFYIFVYKFYHQKNTKGVILIQLEILIHFLYTFVMLFYSNHINNFQIVYNFYIIFTIYNIFRIAILSVLKNLYI